MLKGDITMELANCPYCDMPGMVTRVTLRASGLDMVGKCTVCGYSVDSDYDRLESADDVPGEFSWPLDKTAAD
jgi:hypothetical protein